MHDPKNWSDIRLVDMDAPFSHERRVVPTKAHDIHAHAQTVRLASAQLRMTMRGLECYKENIEDCEYD